jgi:hypothetical protein
LNTHAITRLYRLTFIRIMTRPLAAAAEMPEPEARELPVKSALANIYRPTELPTGNDWMGTANS